MDPFKIESLAGSQPGIRILKLTGPFTLAAVFDFQAVARQDPAPLTIIDLTGVPYMDSAALGSVLGVHVSCQKESRKYGLVGVSDRLKTLFRVAGVAGLMPIYASLDEAEGNVQATSA